MLRMKASAVMWNEARSPEKVQAAERTSRSKRTWSVWVGVKAVKSCVPTSLEGVVVHAVRPPERATLFERAGGGAGEYPVAVGAGLGVAPGVEAVGSHLRSCDGYVVRPYAVQVAG
jgi:hypothetical protein